MTPHANASSFDGMSPRKKEVYLTLSSKDSLKIFPNNEANDFTVNLPEPLIFDSNWSVGLCDIQYSQPRSSSKNLWIYMDLVAESIVGDTKKQLLRRIAIGPQHRGTIVTRYPDLQLLPLARHVVRTITLHITGDKGKGISFQDKLVICTLVFVHDE